MIHICMVVLIAQIHNAPVICEAADELERIADEQDLPWQILVAIGIHESRWTITAHNRRSGARGVFQQIPYWSPLGWRDLMTLEGALDGLWHSLDRIRKWPRAGQSIPELLCTYGTGKSKLCDQIGLRGISYSRTVERLSGELFLVSAMLGGDHELE